MDYSLLIETIVEDLLEDKDATPLFSPYEVERLGGPEYLSRERLVSMPITQFLQLASELKSGENKEKKDRLEKALNSGDTIHEIPHLSFVISGANAKVTGHEGRHRAFALLRRGFDRMPVSLKSRESKEGVIRWSAEEAPNAYSGKVKSWPKILIGQDDRLTIPFPISREDAHKPYVVPEEKVEEAAQGFINDLLLTEIIKANLGFGAPVSTNIRYGALFGDIIKKARDEGKELGLKGADQLSVIPMGGSGGSLHRGYDIDTGSGKKSVPPRIYAGVPQEKTGGIPTTKHIIAHEVGHWLNKDVDWPDEDYEEVKKIRSNPQLRLEREVKAVATSREFSRRHGIETDPEQDQINLNTYRRDVMRPAAISPEGKKKEHHLNDADTQEAVAVLMGKFDVGTEQERKDYTSRRIVSGKKIYAGYDSHRRALTLKALGIEED